MDETGLTVFCVCVGDKYHSGYVYALKEMVEKNLSIPHRFKCITTRKLDGIETINPPIPYQGWWGKLSLFYPRVATGPSLYFDLDVVITGNLDYLVDFTEHKFSAPANWARSGHGGIQSSVMAWRGNWTEPFDKIKDKWKDRTDLPSGHTLIDGKEYWGDQEWLYDLLGDDWIRIPGVYSYKYHATQTVPEDASVIVFHGKPDYPEVDNGWIREATGGWYLDNSKPS